MLNSHPEGLHGADASDALATARQVHRVCERFEAAWRSGPRPRIEDYLEGDEGPCRTRLVEELIALEIELRRSQCEHPTIHEYLTRFPDFSEVVGGLFGQSTTIGLSPDQTVIWPPIQSTLNDSEPVGDVSEKSSHRSSPPSQGERFGKYELLSEIARGGMGVVYRARDTVLNREVAVKMILSGSLATDVERARFRREAKLAANLDHRNIVPIHEVGEQDGFLYFTMRLVEGGSLTERVDSFGSDPHAAGRLIVVLARAIHYANDKGFVHCDLKPSNILMDRDGVPQITDFGLARQASTDSSLTASGAVLGTPSYMAPEQASGQREAISPATDVYGLGAIFYELLTGRPPFRMPTMMETVLQALYNEPTPPRELRPELPRELESICLKCLEKAPQDRYPSAEALADDLVRSLQGETIDATGTLRKLRRWTRREPEVVSRLAGLGLVSLLTEYNFHVGSSNPDPVAHVRVQTVLALWAGLTLLFQRLHRNGWDSDPVRRLWSTGDMVCLTLLLWILDGQYTPLLIGYPLMIAASGLWFREGIVWFTTALAIFGYLTLYLRAGLDWSRGTPAWIGPDVLPYANIYIACLALTGFVVARMVKRFLVISQYYEIRRNA
ncbi:serine/threonine-protein kinase [Paludisphaera borealis]|uniref:Serine/threonine-protein kinase PrkC n=1 Tax=Paludisphaera borealis TaxID=1387353 RepID=A0A1U7CPD8_9BACT|nr:serine/threonine-protein kinase [Paludisphaera borealis]APW60804.1 Serine/threonine-protein kinase PrkC [Paludisphaera borealis]